MQIGPKYKLCRRLGSEVFEKCQTQKFALREARTSKRMGKNVRRGRRSEFATQLLEKQKARYMYGITEEQFRRYVKEAKGQNPAQKLYSRLEQRLDNTVYRLGLARTRRMARQLVVHGHIMVNDKKVTIPSYKVTKGSVITIRPQSTDKGIFLGIDEILENYSVPSWLSFDKKEKTGKVVGDPLFDATESVVDLMKVLGFYSR